MEQKKFDWTYFKRRIYIKNCTKEDLFKKWATPKGLTEWFIAEADYEFDDKNFRKPNEIVKVNDRYKWKFQRGSVITGKVLQVKENSLFKFTFGKKEPGSEEDVIVEVVFSSETDNRSRIELHQKNIAYSEYGHVNYNLSCMIGWCYFLTNLRSVFESGHDLREKEKDLALGSQEYTLERLKNKFTA